MIDMSLLKATEASGVDQGRAVRSAHLHHTNVLRRPETLQVMYLRFN